MKGFALFTAGAALALLMAGCASTPQGAPSSTTESTAHWAQETGKAQVTPGETVYPSAMPGASEVMGRGYEGAPPMIPHDITAMTVTQEYNTCLACHLNGETDREGHRATPIPNSHFTDLYAQSYEKDRAKAIQTYRNSTLPSQHGLLGTRYVCTQCHAPQADIKPWVPSTF
jgi:cytochrome c-type protein NapB